MKTLDSIVSRAGALREVILRRVELGKREKPKILTVNCSSLRLVDIRNAEGIQQVRVTRKEKDVVVLKGRKGIQVS